MIDLDSELEFVKRQLGLRESRIVEFARETIDLGVEARRFPSSFVKKAKRPSFEQMFDSAYE